MHNDQRNHVFLEIPISKTKTVPPLENSKISWLPQNSQNSTPEIGHCALGKNRFPFQKMPKSSFPIDFWEPFPVSFGGRSTFPSVRVRNQKRLGAAINPWPGAVPTLQWETAIPKRLRFLAKEVRFCNGRFPVDGRNLANLARMYERNWNHVCVCAFSIYIYKICFINVCKGIFPALSLQNFFPSTVPSSSSCIAMFKTSQLVQDFLHPSTVGKK